ncbi:MAG: hypothetical protein AB1566_02775 [Chloroflexota bacterium]|jgi:hypothetical protein
MAEAEAKAVQARWVDGQRFVGLDSNGYWLVVGATVSGVARLSSSCRIEEE